jgi:hypothetical protein
VYRILTRMVEALESVFSGGAKEQVLTAEKTAVTRAAEETAQARMAVAGQLVDIQQRLAAGITTDEAAARLRQVVSGLVSTGPDDGQAPPAAVTDKVPAFAVVAAPEDVAAQPDASAPADAPAAEEQQPAEPAAAVG